MWKWVIGVVVVLFLLVLIFKPEWLSMLGEIFKDFIQANET